MENRSVFILEDSQLIRDRLIDKLAHFKGIGSITHAVDLQTAYVMLNSSMPDIMILDIQLPDGSGIDVLSKIRKATSNTIVIILTNYPYSIIKRRCIELGADYFFDKSTEFEKVFEILETIN